MKKFLSLLLAAMMLLGCLPAMAEDAEWKINQYTGLVSRLSTAEKLDSIVVPAEVTPGSQSSAISILPRRRRTQPIIDKSFRRW